MKIKIIDYEKKYKEQVIQLILDIQNKEAGINLSRKEQPDLEDIQNSYMDKGFKILLLDTPSVAKDSHTFYEQNGFMKIAKEDLPISYEFPDRNSYLYLKQL